MFNNAYVKEVVTFYNRNFMLLDSFINVHSYYLVFRWLCFPACLRYPHYPGAAGVFDVPPVLHTRTPRHEELYYTVSC